jgi:hypothetical protein
MTRVITLSDLVHRLLSKGGTLPARRDGVWPDENKFQRATDHFQNQPIEQIASSPACKHVLIFRRPNQLLGWTSQWRNSPRPHRVVLARAGHPHLLTRRSGCFASHATTKITFRMRPIDPSGKSPKICPPPRAKIFRLTCRANQWFDSARLTRKRGGSRSSRTLR